MLSALLRRSEWIFSSPSAARGHLTEPRIAHTRALQVAGLPDVSLHSLRRSFGTLSEWLEVPTGVVAQIQGRKPSALVEKHDRRRPLDPLRMWHVVIAAWNLEQGGDRVPADAAIATRSDGVVPLATGFVIRLVQSLYRFAQLRKETRPHRIPEKYFQ